MWRHRGCLSGSGIHDAAIRCRATKITDRSWELWILLSTDGSIWMVGGCTPFLSQTTKLAWHRCTDDLCCPWGKHCMKTLPILSEWSGPHAKEHLPGCCANLEGELAWAWCSSGCKTWDESLGGSVWTIWSHLTWWCMTRPWRCRTSGTQPENKLRQEPCYSLEHCLHR